MNPIKRLIQFGKKLLPRIGILTLAVLLSKGKIQFTNVECMVTVAIVMGITDIVIDVIQNHGNKIVIGFCDYHIFWIY